MTNFTPHYYTPKRPSTQRAKPPRPPRIQKKYIIRAVLCILLITSMVVGIPLVYSAYERHVYEQNQKAFSQTLSGAIDPIISAYPGYTVGVGLVDLSTKTLRVYGKSTKLEAASTGKILTALAYYSAVEAGTTNLTHKVGAFTADYQMKQMINQSNNDSWELLVTDLGRPALQRYAISIGSDYSVGDNTISPGSMAQILSKLYAGDLLNDDHTQELLSYMQDTNDETLIPEAVDSGITTYHKYGLLGGNLHDVGLLSSGGKTFALAIYTQNDGTRADDVQTEIIHKLTKTVASTVF